ncbi:MAG: hypothetical protein IJ060_04880 [Oscillospiraceae bacterium]|nr:hypothetical protein [Oscillospiraceae bacterium]
MSRKKSKKGKNAPEEQNAAALQEQLPLTQEQEAVPAEEEAAPETIPEAAAESTETAQKPAEPATEPTQEKQEAAAEDKQQEPKKIVDPARTKPRNEEGNPEKTDQYGNPVPDPGRRQQRRREPVRTTTPADIKKPQVSFMNSIAHVEAESLPKQNAGAASTAQAYDHAVLRNGADEDAQYSPKIRRMSDSTRAKELRRRRTSGEKLPYGKDTPVSTPQTLPASKLRRRDQNAAKEVLERIPDPLKAHPLDEARPVDYIGKAPHTQINLSADNRKNSADINIDVRYQNERRERADLPKKAKEASQTEDRAAIRSDLQELKTNLLLRSTMLGILAVFSGVLTLLDWIPALPMPAAFSSRTSPFAFLTIQLLLGLAALPFCRSLLKNGYLKLLTFRADCDSLAAMSMMTAELAAFLALPSADMLKNGVVSVYIPIGLLSLFLNAVGKRMIVTRALVNLDRLSDGNPKFGIHYVEDEKRAENLTRGTTGDFPILAAMQPVAEPEDFLKYTFSTDIADKFCRAAVPLITVLSVLFSVIMGFSRSGQVESGVCYGVSIFALCFSACACAAITLVSNLPMATGAKDYVRNSGLLLGYQSVDDFFDVNTIMVDAQTLFPRGTTKLESIQVLGESRIEEAVQYSMSLSKHAGSILKDLFAGAILTEDQLLLPVENYAYDDGKGISGWIQNKRVLLGTRDMMIEHNIEGLPVTAKVESLMPPGTEALYLAVSGTVAALYIVRLEAGKSIKHWMREIERENLFLLVRSNDALLTQRRIAKMFGISEERIKVLPSRLEEDYAAETVPLKKSSPSMLCAGRLAGFVQTIIGAKRIRSAATLGLILQIVTACIGFIYVILFILLRAYSDISGGLLLVYQIICTVCTIMAVRMKDI